MGRSLLIADLQSQSLGGHFALWMERTIREAAKHFDSLHIYVADEISRPNHQLLRELRSCDLTVTLIPEVYHQRRCYGDILGLLAAHHAASRDGQLAPIFLMWAQQYLERDLIFPPRCGMTDWRPWRKRVRFSSPWGTMTSISSVAHEAEVIPLMERRVHEEVQAEPCCEGILLWDDYAVRKLGGKYLYLPDVEPLASDDAWRLPESGKITAGSVGQLWGYRSINLLAEILVQEPTLQGYVSGVLKPESYSPEARKLTEGGDRLVCEEGFVPDDRELNQRLKKLDAFVIDSRTYKCPSGLGIRAMAMGRPVISVDSSSWIASLIREKGVGVFWQKGEGNLSEKLREWYDSGGSLRSKETAHQLSDEQGLELAYSTLFDRLKNRIEKENRVS